MIYKNVDVENIIVVSKEKVILEKEDTKLLVSLSDKLDFYDIIKMNIEVKENTNLLIFYKEEKDIKLDIQIVVKENVTFTLKEIKESLDSKIQEKYYLEENATLDIQKFYDTNSTKELNIAYLNGMNASITSSIKGIIKDNTKIDMLVYHNYPKTNSNLTNHFVTIKEGTIRLNVTTMIYNKMKNCIAHQNNHIVNQNQSASIIQPNLLIEENDIEASHSANISEFDQDILYYMYTRGIKKETAMKMLIEGFLKTDFIDIVSYIEKYWG
jgi:Fe-S cluster assembly protein SufD